MPAGERFRSGGARSVARFLEEHQGHGGGFDVQREQGQGTGRLRILCHGCGQSVDYQAADVGDFVAPGAETAATNGAAPVPVPPEPAAAVPTPVRRSEAAPASRRPPARPVTALPPRQPPDLAGMRRSRRQPRGRSRLPRILATAAIATLIIGGLTMIAVGLLRNTGDEAATTSAPPTGPKRQSIASAKHQRQRAPQATTPAPTANPAQTNPSAQPGTTASAGAGGILRTRQFENAFEIGVPANWRSGKQDQAILLRAPRGVAEIDVYFGPEAISASGLTAFLLDRDPGAQIGKPRPVRIGGRRGQRVVATLSDATETATILDAGDLSYLVIEREDRGVSPAIDAQADASVASFKPV